MYYLLLLLLLLVLLFVLSIGVHTCRKGRSRTTSGPAPMSELQRQCGGHRRCEEPLLAHTWGVSGESVNRLLCKTHACTQGRHPKPPWIWRLLTGWNRRSHRLFVGCDIVSCSPGWIRRRSTGRTTRPNMRTRRWIPGSRLEVTNPKHG